MSEPQVEDKSLEQQENLRKSTPPRKPDGRRPTKKAGARLGRWTLLKPLARGGMGEVYLATAGGIEGAERPCVVKLIRREHSQDSSFLARFFDEARIQAQLQHPGVAQVLEASTDESGKPYVVLEHVEGRNLSEVRQRAAQLKMPLSWADAVAVAVTLAEALAHVHERTDAMGRALAIVHRDMSPQNVMIGYAGDVKLIDFGTARGENRRCQTVSGVVFAKPGYVAPEVANQNQPGPQADLYALGVILWELTMGRRFLTGDPSEHLAKVASGERAPSAVSSSANVPLELDTIIARLTAYDLADRYQTAREALGDLVRVLSRAPSLADGERSVRGRIAHLMNRLYPSEPMRTRAEFARLLAEHRHEEQPNPFVPESPNPMAATALLPGTRYQLLDQLSKSEMSVVYRAVHIDLERRVALKILPKERCDNPHFEARFRKEAKALAQLRDEGLVTLHDFGVSQDGRPYYAMELLDGQTLTQRVSEGPLGWKHAVKIGIDVCRALEAAHARDVVHRDIKPSNVFLTATGKVKLLDFGVAQAGEDELIETDDSNAIIVTGTPDYMAPEQIGHEEVSVQADVYALATVLYELITGQLPYRAETTVQLLDEKRRGSPLAPRKLHPNSALPSGIDGVLLKALDPSPAARYPTARRFRDALEGIVARSERGRLRGTLVAAAALSTFAGAAVAAGWLTAERAPVATPTWLSAEASGQEEPALAKAGSLPAALTADGTAVNDETYAMAPEAALPPSNDGTPTEEADDELAAGELARGPVAAEPEDLPEAETVEPEAIAADEGEAARSAANGEAELSEAEQARLDQGNRLLVGDAKARLRALDLFRKLAEAHPNHPDVLHGWSRAAAKNKWWGESLQVALRWASTDDSAEAKLHLARTQRLVGQRYGAIQTLERLLVEAPEHAEATAMLQRYRGR